RGPRTDALSLHAALPILLEPIQILEITVPESNMGDVIGDLSSRRGQVLGTEIVAGRAIITAQVPLAEVLRYSNDLRSFTQGRGRSEEHTSELQSRENLVC